MSKYKEFQEYVDKVTKAVRDAYNFDGTYLAEVETIENIDKLLECYLTCVRPKDCAKKIVGVVDE